MIGLALQWFGKESATSLIQAEAKAISRASKIVHDKSWRKQFILTNYQLMPSFLLHYADWHERSIQLFRTKDYFLNNLLVVKLDGLIGMLTRQHMTWLLFGWNRLGDEDFGFSIAEPSSLSMDEWTSPFIIEREKKEEKERERN